MNRNRLVVDVVVYDMYTGCVETLDIIINY